MKMKKGLGSLGMPLGLGSMPPPMAKPPMGPPPMKRVMKMKGSPLAGFAPSAAPKKAKKKVKRGSRMPPGLMI